MQRVRLDAPQANAGVDDASRLLELENHNFFTNVRYRARQAQPREMIPLCNALISLRAWKSLPLILTHFHALKCGTGAFLSLSSTCRA
jgi:hypothetical protein